MNSCEHPSPLNPTDVINYLLPKVLKNVHKCIRIVEEWNRELSTTTPTLTPLVALTPETPEESNPSPPEKQPSPKTPLLECPTPTSTSPSSSVQLAAPPRSPTVPPPPTAVLETKPTSSTAPLEPLTPILGKTVQVAKLPIATIPAEFWPGTLRPTEASAQHVTIWDHPSYHSRPTSDLLLAKKPPDPPSSSDGPTSDRRCPTDLEEGVGHPTARPARKATSASPTRFLTPAIDHGTTEETQPPPRDSEEMNRKGTILPDGRNSLRSDPTTTHPMGRPPRNQVLALPASKVEDQGVRKRPAEVAREERRATAWPLPQPKPLRPVHGTAALPDSPLLLKPHHPTIDIGSSPARPTAASIGRTTPRVVVAATPTKGGRITAPPFLVTIAKPTAAVALPDAASRPIKE